MKRYEGLFILNTAGKEEGVKETIDKITATLQQHGGTIETIQKMDKRAFARVADKKHLSGFYVNVIFRVAPAKIAVLDAQFASGDEVFRVMFTEAPAAPAAAAK